MLELENADLRRAVNERLLDTIDLSGHDSDSSVESIVETVKEER